MPKISNICCVGTLAAMACLTTPAVAQTTNCRQIGSTWTCNTTQPPPPIVVRGVDAGVLIDSWRRGREDRQRDDQERISAAPATPPTTGSNLAAVAGSSDILQTGNGLLDTCRSNDSLLEFTCLAFVKGVVEGSSGALEIGNHSPLICSPGGVTIGQNRDILIKWLVEHPEWRHLSATAAILRSLSATFPCNKK